MRTLVSRFHLLLCATTIAITAVGFLRIPADWRFPAHWSGSGADWLWPRASLLAAPAIEVLVMLAFHLLGARLTKNHFSKTQHILEPALTLILSIVTTTQMGLLIAGIGSDLDLIRLTGFVLGAVFLVLGVVLFEAERHTYGGLRMPWPIDGDRAWVMVHRAAGISVFLAGSTLLWVAWRDIGAGGLILSFAAACALPPCAAALLTWAMRGR